MISLPLIAPYFRGYSETRQGNCRASENPVGAYSFSAFLTILKSKFRQNILDSLHRNFQYVFFTELKAEYRPVEEGAVILLDQRIASGLATNAFSLYRISKSDKWQK